LDDEKVSAGNSAFYEAQMRLVEEYIEERVLKEGKQRGGEARTKGNGIGGARPYKKRSTTGGRATSTKPQSATKKRTREKQ
jgi:hypothetical protein